MKLIKRIAAAFCAIALLSSCGILQGGQSNTASTTTTPTSTGSNTGSALASVLGVLLNNGSIDLGNLANIINIVQILTGANSLVGATDAYTQQFTNGLIKGSNKVVTSANAPQVISALKSLATQDSTPFTKAAATKGYAQSSPALSYSDPKVSGTMTELTKLLNTLK